MTIISLRGLTKRYGDVLAVDDLSFDLEPGSVTGFVGANGAGKSTTLRMLLGLTRPTSGSALVGGVPYLELPAPVREVGALTDPDVFHPRRSGRDALRVFAAASAVPDRRVEEVLALEGVVPVVARNPELSEWMPSGAGAAVIGADGATMPALLGAVVVLGYAVALATLAGASFVRRDPL